MHRIFTTGSSATPPEVPESMPFPNHYPTFETPFHPYTAHTMIEELVNIATVNGAELDPESNNQCITAIQALIAAAGVGNPTGAILDFAGTTAPPGYLLCNGSLVSRTTYAALFAIIGVQYGAGDGSTTFQLPDVRGRFRLGKDDMGGTPANRVTSAQADVLGGNGGAETHTLTIGEMPAHSHNVPMFTGGEDGGARNTLGGGGAQSTTSAGGGQAHNNMPPYITFNAIIKY